jgi:hypothetical protein
MIGIVIKNLMEFSQSESRSLSKSLSMGAMT